MASTKTEIANNAFRFLGARRIDDFDEDSKEAHLARDTYDSIRDQVLRDHPWNFASKRTKLTPLSEAPTWEFSRAFALPTDCLRVLKVNGEDPESYRWRVEGRSILTDLTSPIELLYVYRNLSVGEYDASFVMALSYSLAFHWAETLTKTAALKGEMLDAYRVQLSGARTSDGQESTVQMLESNDWIDVRY